MSNVNNVDGILATLREALAQEGQAQPVDRGLATEAEAPPVSSVIILACSSHDSLCIGIARLIVPLVVLCMYVSCCRSSALTHLRSVAMPIHKRLLV